MTQPPVPFFIRPITGIVAGTLNSEYLTKELEMHFQFLEERLSSAPDSGPFLCGNHLTTADIQMSIPAQTALWLAIIKAEQYPRIASYVKQIESMAGYRKAAQKVEEIEGKPFVPI